jgi:hypothetical protein
MFEIVVGPRKIRHIMAREKSCPIAVCHFEKMAGSG